MTSSIDERTAARDRALAEQLATQRRLARPEEYVFDKAQEAFWDLRDGSLHTAVAVDASIPQELWRVVVEEGDEAPPEGERRPRGRPRQRRERLVKPSSDIMRIEHDQFVEGSTWWPGQPQIIRDQYIDANGPREAAGRRIYNQYRPAPLFPHGNPLNAHRWIEHVRKLWPDPKEHNYFFDYCAHMVQRPEEKCNAAVVLSGTQGIGKDAALEPVKAAIGTWNMKNIDPDNLFDSFNPWVQTLMLVVDEVRPTQDEFRATSMYNILKPLIVAPPNTLPLNEKHAKLRHIVNVLRVFITTNDWMAMYIPPEDRRMFIMHSNLPQRWHETEGRPEYFMELFAWFESGGAADVAAWLRARDLSRFGPKTQVEKTAGWVAVAQSWDRPDDALTAALETLGRPSVVFGSQLLEPQFDHREEIAGLLKSPRRIAHRMEAEGYLMLKHPVSERWVFHDEAGELRVRSRYAFVQRALATGKTAEEVRTTIEDAGKALAASLPGDGPNGKVVNIGTRKG